MIDIIIGEGGVSRLHRALDERTGAAAARLGAPARMLQRGGGCAADVPEREPDESSSPPPPCTAP